MNVTKNVIVQIWSQKFESKGFVTIRTVITKYRFCHSESQQLYNCDATGYDIRSASVSFFLTSFLFGCCLRIHLSCEAQ